MSNLFYLSPKRILLTVSLLLTVILIVLVINDKEISVSKAFYYWRTEFKLNDTEKRILHSLDVKKIYIKFFDVEFDHLTNQPSPVGQIVFSQKVDESLQVVPVIYITNKTLQKIPHTSIDKLARNIFSHVSAIAKNNNLQFDELQLDCDWSGTTKHKYFELAAKLKSLLGDKILSSTIRLHQIKYYERTGIPPVDRGMLMFYNMGEINADSLSNSIFDETEAAKYTGYIFDYPLPLDVALPVFSWIIQLRNNKPVNILDRSSIGRIRSENRFVMKSKDYYVADSSFFFNGSYIMKNDILKIEEMNSNITSKAAEMIYPKLKRVGRTVALFDLDSINLKSYSHDDIEKIYRTFK